MRLFVPLLTGLAIALGFPSVPAVAATTPAESVGLDSAEIAAVLETVRQREIPLDSLYIERDGKPVLDVYVYPFGPTLRHDVASISKSITALTAGAVFADRPEFGMNQTLRPGSEIRLGDALSMRTGLACGDRVGEPELFAVMASPDWVAATEALPRRSPPDTTFSYCSPAYLLASAFVGRATGASLADQAGKHIFAPLGITDWRWAGDPQGNTRGWGDLDLRVPDLVKIGRVLLNEGVHEGRTVVPADWIMKATTPRSIAPGGDGYGYGFWLRTSAPGMIEGRGRGGQGLIIWPSQRLLVAITASDTDDGQTLPLLASIRPRPQPLARNIGGEQRLAKAVAALAQPPASHAPGRPGRRAAAFLGRPLAFADSTWIRSITVTQSGQGGVIHIGNRYRDFDARIGFDGVPRLTEGGPDDGAVSGKAEWRSPNRLMIEVRPYALAQRVTFDLVFGRREVKVSAREASGLFAIETIARPFSP